MASVLKVAVHEAGHAVAVFVINEMTRCYSTGYPEQVEEVVIGRDGGHCLSNEWIEASGYACCSKIPLYRDYTAKLNIIRIMVGPAAVLQWQTRSRVEPAWCFPEVIAKIRAAPKQSSCDNLGDFAKVARWLAILGLLDDDAEITRLWRTACALVDVEFPGIVAAARVLATRERMKMTGEQFRRVWRKNRPHEAVRLRRAGIGIQKLDWLRGEEAITESFLNAGKEPPVAAHWSALGPEAAAGVSA